MIAYRDTIEGDGEEAGEVDDGFARKNVVRNRKKWVVEDLKVLPDEDAFFAYEDPRELVDEGRLPKQTEEQIPTFESVFGDEADEGDDDDY